MHPLTLLAPLNTWLVWLTADTPTPSPSPVINEDMVTPGVIGFLATFFIAAATVLLVVDMTRRVRRVRYRAEVQEQLDAEERQADGGSGSDSARKEAKPAPED